MRKILLTEIKVLYQSAKQAYRENRDQGGEPIHALIAGFKAYQDLMRIKPNWWVTGIVTTIIFGIVLIYEFNWGLWA